jgi:hypothetical protein
MTSEAGQTKKKPPNLYELWWLGRKKSKKLCLKSSVNKTNKDDDQIADIEMVILSD